MSDTPQLDDEKPKDDEEALALAKRRFKLCQDNEADIRQLGKEDAEFSLGDQWPAQIRADRDRKGKPTIVVNKVAASLHQVTNDQRQNRPSIKVNPVDEGADIETAKILNGMIRHIEYASGADVAYDRGLDGAARRSYGFIRVIADYCDSMSFDQELYIKSVRNPDSCILGPHQEPDGSDAPYGFAFEDLSKDDFKAQFPKSKLAASEDWEAAGASMPDWVKKGGARVADYYFKEFKDIEIWKLSTGDVIEALKDGEQLPDDILAASQGAPVGVVAKRKTQKTIVNHWKICGADVLDKTTFPGEFIPIVPVYGDEVEIDGKVHRISLVRNAKDPQRMYNYYRSSEAETVALGSKAPWIGYKDSFEGLEKFWDTANSENHAYLPANSVDSHGNPLPLPSRNSFEPPIQSLTQGAMLASDDIKGTTNIYDTTLGNQSNEKSGIAIQRRNAQSQTGNFHFVDNLTRSIRHVGRILVGAIPVIYDTPRMVRILGEDGTPEMVPINQPYKKNGKELKHTMNAGKYDVTVSTGPSYQTKRQESQEMMIELTKAIPQIGQVGADLLMKTFDFHLADKLSERLKAMLPPGVAQDENQDQPIPPQVKQMFDQQGQMVEMLTQENHALKSEAAMKRQELESKERIELAKIQAQLEIESAKLGSQQSIVLLQTQIQQLQEQQERMHMAQLHDQEREYSIQDAQMDRQNQLEDAEAQRQFEMSQNPTGGASPGMATGGLSPGDQGENEWQS